MYLILATVVIETDATGIENDKPRANELVVIRTKAKEGGGKKTNQLRKKSNDSKQHKY